MANSSHCPTEGNRRRALGILCQALGLSEHHGPYCVEIGVWGHSRMRTAEKYRRFGQECAELARTAKSLQNQAVLLHMAQVWFRLAEGHAAHVAETIED